MYSFFKVVLCCSLCVSIFGPAFAGEPGEAGVAVITVPFASTLVDDGTRDDEVLYGMTAEVRPGLREVPHTLLQWAQDGTGLRELKMSYGYTWVESKNFAVVSKDEADRWRSSVTHQIIAPFADILPEALTESYPPLITLPRGAYIIVGEPSPEDERWASVELFGGKKGWVRRELTREIRRWNENGEEETRKNLVADALSYLGASYRWGGKTMTGLDCSGLTHMIYGLNGLEIYRNSRPKDGFPIALKHVPGAEGDIHTRATLASVKPGDLIYWSGHVAFYLGDGKYIHSNGKSFGVVINSLLPDDPDYREDLAKPSAIYTWGTAFPDEPDKLIVRDFYARPFTADDGRTGWRFYVRADGYAPNRAVLYPEGRDGPSVEIAAPRRMMYDSSTSEHKDVPVYFYSKPGDYRPAVLLVNDEGYRPSGETISSDIFEMREPITVTDCWPGR